MNKWLIFYALGLFIISPECYAMDDSESTSEDAYVITRARGTRCTNRVIEDDVVSEDERMDEEASGEASFRQGLEQFLSRLANS